MTKITINTPIWSKRAIGIAEDKMTSNYIVIEITYEKQDGQRLYPDKYYILRDHAMCYPTQELKGHRLHIIPIGHLRVIPDAI